MLKDILWSLSKRALGETLAYTFELDAEVPAVPFVDPWGTVICEFALGYDIERNVATIMSVMFYSGAKASHVKSVAGVFDLRFGIRERNLDHDWKVTPPDYSREAADEFIPRANRREVKERLYDAIEVLLGYSKAKHVTMQSYYPWLPRIMEV